MAVHGTYESVFWYPCKDESGMIDSKSPESEIVVEFGTQWVP